MVISSYMRDSILLVDDNAVQAATRKAILERSGQQVTVASCASEALSMLDNAGRAKGFGLVITDHLMPGMNGPEFVGELREGLPSIPILVLSGLPEAEEQYRGLRVVFRCKPFPPAALVILAREMMDEPDEPMSRTA